MAHVDKTPVMTAIGNTRLVEGGSARLRTTTLTMDDGLTIASRAAAVMLFLRSRRSALVRARRQVLRTACRSDGLGRVGRSAEEARFLPPLTQPVRSRCTGDQ